MWRRSGAQSRRGGGRGLLEQSPGHETGVSYRSCPRWPGLGVRWTCGILHSNRFEAGRQNQTPVLSKRCATFRSTALFLLLSDMADEGETSWPKSSPSGSTTTLSFRRLVTAQSTYTLRLWRRVRGSLSYTFFQSPRLGPDAKFNGVLVAVPRVDFDRHANRVVDALH